MYSRKHLTLFLWPVISLFIICFTFTTPAAAQEVPAGEDIGATQLDDERVKERKAVAEDLIKGKEPAPIEEPAEPAKPAEELKVPEEKVLISNIDVTGVTLIEYDNIRSIVSLYEGRKLSLSDFREIADYITDEYRSLGYVTSMAYLPPQKIDKDRLEIRVIEGTVGEVTLSGNEYFKTERLLSYLDLHRGDYLNYDLMRRNVNRINEHPDRTAKVVLSRGKEYGETDVDVQVEDQLPIHVTLGYNNYNSRYLERNKFSAEIRSNNLLGMDDIAALELQTGEDTDLYILGSARYLFPVSNRLKLGANYSRIEQELGRDLKSLQIEGEGNVASVFFTYNLVNNENVILNLNGGFDYKDMENKILGIQTSEDNVRIIKAGVDLDIEDAFNGRTIITSEFDFGIEEILGGMDEVDPNASRTGAGGRFVRNATNAARIQSMPWETSLMLKGGLQLTNYDLVASEQFQVGGATTVRGYPRAEYVGDVGFNGIVEYYIPPFGLPKTLKVPASQSYFYDAIRLVGFFDYGYVEYTSIQVGETKDEDIYSAGAGIRFNIPERLSVSFDYGFQLAQEASDGSDSAAYVEVKLFY